MTFGYWLKHERENIPQNWDSQVQYSQCKLVFVWLVHKNHQAIIQILTSRVQNMLGSF